jgi:hypothetical protein
MVKQKIKIAGNEMKNEEKITGKEEVKIEAFEVMYPWYSKDIKHPEYIIYVKHGYAIKELLKRRGFRFDAVSRDWWKAVDEKEMQELAKFFSDMGIPVGVGIFTSNKGWEEKYPILARVNRECIKKQFESKKEVK